MANDARKVSELGTTVALGANDRIVVLTNPSSAPAVQTITLDNLTNNLRYASPSVSGVVKIGSGLAVTNNTVTIRLSTSVPAAANSSGIAGTIVYDSSFVYICVAANTWKRAALSTW